MPVLTSEQHKPKTKERKIRNSEYYDLEGTFDRLYAESRSGKTFHNLMSIIESEENIRLAYRTLKKNKGSGTAGTDGRAIKDLAEMSEEEYIRLIRKQFSSYHTRPVRRVEIPKPSGKMRPLGIPTIVDRIVQQCIMQVMEPVCEARFSDNSYGFRPNRSAENAIAHCMRLIQVQHMYHVVDFDIKGFFDNVNHAKLIRQIWALGIRDKKLICIIKQMLTAPIVMPDGTTVVPDRGTPQGGILSPLLANIVLNELDWWISSQWETMPTQTEFKTRNNKQGTEIRSHIYRALRRSNLKEMHSVRYADDFKIFCATHEDAVKAYKATEEWLKERLGLDISPEKSKVINLKTQYSDFLGFKMKVRKKGKRYVVRSHMSDKAQKKAHDKLSEGVNSLQHPMDDRDRFIRLMKYNAVVSGIHEYYTIATDTVDDFRKLAFCINRQLRNRLKKDISRNGTLRDGFIKEKYGWSKQMRFINGRPIIPVGAVHPRNALNRNKSVNKYTPEGRTLIHRNLKINTDDMLWLMRHPLKGKSIEYSDNILSLYAAQYGKCGVTGQPMDVHDICAHHKVPKNRGGTDEYSNLILVTKEIHSIIREENEAVAKVYANDLKLDDKAVKKLNKLRKTAGMSPINI